MIFMYVNHFISDAVTLACDWLCNSLTFYLFDKQT